MPSTPFNGGSTLSQGRSLARALADVAATAAQRVRARDVRGAAADLRRIVQNQPGAALLTAAVLGFVLMRSLSRR